MTRVQQSFADRYLTNRCIT